MNNHSIVSCFILSERAADLQHKISSWDFSPVDLSHDDLVHCSYLIFDQVLTLPELSHLSITQGELTEKRRKKGKELEKTNLGYFRPTV